MADSHVTTSLRRTAPIAPNVDRPGLSLHVELGLGVAKLRIYGPDADARFSAILGIAPPSAREQADASGLTIAWLAPGEWMATGPEAEVADWVARLDNAGDEDALAIDFTHARTAFVLAGTAARAAIASHCPLDLWPDVFPVSAVARSLLGDTGMFIARLADNEDGPRFRIIVDQTMAAYAARMLAGA